MTPTFHTLSTKRFIGHKISMSYAENKTFQLWNGFMPKRKQIEDTIGDELYSIEVYPPGYFHQFNPTATFEKWAAVEVPDFDNVPSGMETLIVPEGKYAVFIHRGAASEGPKTYQYIFSEWIPNSEYEVDDRPHFAVMGEKYKHDSSDSEEEIWVPIR